MKIAYFDCPSGISGDMTLAALFDAGVDPLAVQSAIDSLGLPSCQIKCEEVERCGFRALNVKIMHEPEHAHRHLSDIVGMIQKSTLTNNQQAAAICMFSRLAEAEARVHGTTPEKVHFHEVGAVDSIADIVGTAVAQDLLGIDQFVFSPIPTGCGEIEIAHGRCSVPAPATAELLQGVPIASSTIPLELTTPTGATIAITLASSFGPVPSMTIEKIGYGAGTRNLEGQPNILRILVGHTGEDSTLGQTEKLVLLETNLDDETGETVGYTIERLFEAGALDVYTVPIMMKKNRPGVVLTVLCQGAKAEQLESIIFSETTTLGIRRREIERISLPRHAATVETPWGQIEGKVATGPDGIERFSPEFESCRLAARENNVPLWRVFEKARNAFLDQ